MFAFPNCISELLYRISRLEFGISAIFSKMADVWITHRPRTHHSSWIASLLRPSWDIPAFRVSLPVGRWRYSPDEAISWTVIAWRQHKRQSPCSSSTRSAPSSGSTVSAKKQPDGRTTKTSGNFRFRHSLHRRAICWLRTKINLLFRGCQRWPLPKSSRFFDGLRTAPPSTPSVAGCSWRQDGPRRCSVASRTGVTWPSRSLTTQVMTSRSAGRREESLMELQQLRNAASRLKEN